MKKWKYVHLIYYLNIKEIYSFHEICIDIPSCLIEDLQVIEDLQKTYGRPTKIGDIYIKSDAILLIGIS